MSMMIVQQMICKYKELSIHKLVFNFKLSSVKQRKMKKRKKPKKKVTRRNYGKIKKKDGLMIDLMIKNKHPSQKQNWFKFMDMI